MTPRHGRVRRIGAALIGIGLVLLLPAIALAHPLGNFTINHYAGIRVEPTRVILDVVIDQAEIPTFQEKLRIDTDGDGSVSDDEIEAERLTACPILAESLILTVDGTVQPLTPVAAGLSFPPGAAGLETMRLACTYTATPPHGLAAATQVTFHDTSDAERLGWREIVATGSGVTIDAGDLPTTSRSERLTAYPKDLLTQPLDVRSASFTASLGGPTLPPLVVPDAAPLPGAPALYPTATVASGVEDGPAAGGGSSATGPGAPAAALPGSTPGVTSGTEAPAIEGAGAVPGGVGAEVSGLLQTRDLTPFVLLGSLLAAMALGAGHALTPGHGKTLMGAYLVGTRGTAVHAVALGLSVTVSHTLGILVLAAIVIGLRDVLSPEAFNRLAPIASGLLVIGIGGWLLISQVRARRERVMTGSGPNAGTHDHDHDHAQGHDHPHDHAEDHDHLGGPEADAHGHAGEDIASVSLTTVDGMHSHGGIAHSHLPPVGSSISWRSLFVLGLAGGIIPSTNALIILLATIATGRAVYGLVLVVAFGLGMAVVLGGVGLGLVFARGRMDSLPASSSLGRVAAYAPIMAGVLVLSLGIYLTTQAVGVAPSL